MYSILFHVCGIAIVEICFYFYYIGPMETVIFENKVKKIINEPFKTIPLLPSEHNYLERYLSTSNNQTNTLIEQRDVAVKQREEKNYNLFIEIILYWTLLCTIACLSLLAHYVYKRYQNTSADTSIHSEQGIEMENLPLYRIANRTQSHETLEITICTEKRKKVSKKVLYYFLFGCSILGFQYFFFQNIVLKYDPLSIQEVKYILYQNIEHELQENGVIDL